MTITYPVVLFTYKRPGSTLQFLELIKEADVEKLYIFSDGPKNENDRALIEQVRKVIEQFVSENPQIKFNVRMSTYNIGLKQNIIQGLNSVFEMEKAAIILEDDCLPTPDFFKFTAAMLKQYETDTRILSINGTSVGNVGKYSYDFSRYAHCWGWATWGRAWKLYDQSVSGINSNNWPTISRRLWSSNLMRFYWGMMLKMTQASWIDTWDFQWSYSHFLNHGLAIYPRYNLISNIGFDSVATNTKTRSPIALLPTQAIVWPLVHPSEVKENMLLTSVIERKFYNNLIAVIGMLRQYFYWKISKYVNRH